MPPSKVFRSVSTPEVELRFTEVRATSSRAGKNVEGYAAVFNRPAQLPGFREVIRKGAFTRALQQQDDVVCLFNHDSSQVLGRTTSGTLELDQDDRGLHYVCKLPDTSYARDLHESIRRGDINGCSFGFTVDDAGQDWSTSKDADGTEYVLRSISSVKLLDVSPVTYPAYGGTQVAARTAQAAIEFRSRFQKRFKLPSFEECLEITRRSQDRRRQEQEAAETVRRRQAFIKDFLRS